MNNTKKESNNLRLDYLDVAKGIGIILVVMGHTGFLKEGVSRFVFSFHMPLFFIISGMLLHHSDIDNRDIGPLIRKKIRSLMIPYISFSLIYIAISAVELLTGVLSKAEMIQSVIYMFTLYGDSTLWFLPALLIGEILFILLNRKFKGVMLLAISCLLGFAAFWIQMGITPLYAMNMDNLLITNIIDFVRVLLRAVIVTGFIAVGFFGYGLIPRKTLISIALGAAFLGVAFVLSRYNDTVDFHRIVTGNYGLFLSAGVFGSFGVIFLSKGLVGIKILGYFGRNSLIIMCTHLRFYVLFGAIQLAFLINTYVTRAKDYVFMLVILVVSFAVEVLIIELFNRYLPFILGRKNARK